MVSLSMVQIWFLFLASATTPLCSEVVEVFVFDILSPGSPVEVTRSVDGEQQFRMALVETNRRRRG